jgi:hypothetical protein
MADHFIDNTASGLNDGTSWANAWESWADVSWGSVADGDSVYVSGGSSGKTYTENVQIVHAGSSEANRITVATGAAHPTLSSGHDGFVTISGEFQLGDESANRAEYITFNGESSGSINWRITGSSTSGVSCRYSTLDGIKLLYLEIDNNGTGCNDHGIGMSSEHTGWEIAYCHIHDNNGDGINQTGPSSPTGYGMNSVHNCTIADNGDDAIQVAGGWDVYDNVIDGTGSVLDQSPCFFHPDGIQGARQYWRIYRNTFINWDQHIFIETVETDGMQNIQIYNNLFYNTTGSTLQMGVVLKAKTPDSTHTWDNILIANNTFDRMDSLAIRLQNSLSTASIDIAASGLKIQNNIINEPSNKNISEEGTFSISDGDYLLENNSFYRTAGFSVDYRGTNYTNITTLNAVTNADSNNATEVTFQDRTSNDYRISGTDSGAKDLGKTLGDFSDDITGNTRTVPWTIGAYEYIAAPSTRYSSSSAALLT